MHYLHLTLRHAQSGALQARVAPLHHTGARWPYDCCLRERRLHMIQMRSLDKATGEPKPGPLSTASSLVSSSRKATREECVTRLVIKVKIADRCEPLIRLGRRSSTIDPFPCLLHKWEVRPVVSLHEVAFCDDLFRLDLASCLPMAAKHRGRFSKIPRLGAQKPANRLAPS